MHRQTIEVTVGSLLHDIGKPVYRADSGAGTHSELGYSFLKGIDAYKDQKAILNCVRYHHAQAIRTNPPPADDVSYICYIADNIASAADRREAGEEGGFDRQLPLSPIFTHLNGEHPGYAVPPCMQCEKPNMPIHSPTYRLTPGVYNEIISKLKTELSELPPDEEWIDSILATLEAATNTITASTNTKESADISLYDHVKITAAVGACISEYFLAEGITDFKKELFDNEKEFLKKNALILYSADFSGIQKFISTVSTTNALKSLRSRSFFLELAMEHYIDEMLSMCGLSRANLLYSGGGHCYLLLPNTQSTVDIIKSWNRRFNQWLMESFGGILYLADGFVACSPNDLTNTPAEKMPYKELFRNVSSEIARKKNHRYSAEELITLNRKSSGQHTRECVICGNSDHLKEDENGRNLCPWCMLFETLSPKIQFNDIIVVKNGSDSGADFILPTLNSTASFLFTDLDRARKMLRDSEDIRRIYAKNRSCAGLKYSAHIYVGDYAKSNQLSELASMSPGVERLGICRMDVDNLGQAFVSGYEKEKTSQKDQRGYVTISRTAAFSRQLSLFFKSWINSILDGSYQMERPLNVAIVYSGGDDVFLVGSWTDTIEAAKRIREAFRLFSCGSLTISSGISVLDSHYPIRLGANRAAELEDQSKSRTEKNGISLFEPNGQHCYGWDDYADKVEGEKLAALEAFFGNEDNGRGNSLLYRMMELLRDTQEHPEKKIQLARYAYMLARLEPKNPRLREAYRKFSDAMYGWALNSTDRQQLITAIYLYVYRTRERRSTRDGV